MTAQQKLNARLAKLSVSTLKGVVVKLANVHTDEACIVSSAALDQLMARMPDADFIAFCDAL